MAQSKFIADEISFTGKFSKNVFETIAKSFAQFKVRVFVLFAIGLIGRFCLLFSANVMGYWADSLCRAPAHCKPIPEFFQGYGNHEFVNALICFATVGFAINTFFRIAISRIGSRAVSTLYDEVTMRTSRLPMGFFDETPVGRIVTRFSSDYAAIFRMAGGPLGEFLCILFDLILMLVLTVVASPYFLPVLILVVALNYLTYTRSNTGLRIERRLLSKQRGPSIAHFAETVQGASIIKVFGKRKSFTFRYDHLMADFLLQKLKTAVAVHFFSLKMSGITAIMLLATGVAGIWMADTGLVSVGSLGVALTFIMMASSTIQWFFEWLANLEEALTGIERMDHYLRMPLEAGSRMPKHATFAPAAEQSMSQEDLEKFGLPTSNADQSAMIEVKDLTMRYRDDLPPVLNDINFIVRPGEQLAIVGRTGSGKSSLIQALFGLYPFEKGSITLGGISPDLAVISSSFKNLKARGQMPLTEFRRRMALIPQEPNLFRGTIRENLSGVNDLDDGKLWTALEKIGIARWVRSLKHHGQIGLDFRLEEGAKNISQGERQLLCMARALLQDTPIIIMDEATSSVDPASEELLVRATETHMKDKTKIIVAHRLSTIENSDRVMWLDQGRIRMLDRPDVVLPQFQSRTDQS